MIGRLIANSIDAMENLNLSNVHIIGHSLGAHMAGYIGKELKLKGKFVGMGFRDSVTGDIVAGYSR